MTAAGKFVGVRQENNVRSATVLADMSLPADSSVLAGNASLHWQLVESKHRLQLPQCLRNAFPLQNDRASARVRFVPWITKSL